MKTLRGCIIAVLLAGAASPAEVTAAPAGPILPDGSSIPFQGKPKCYRDGRIQQGVLAQDFSLSGHMLPAGSRVEFSEKGGLEACRLGRESPIYGQILPAQTQLFFLGDGRLRMFWLPAATAIQGHLLSGPQTDGQGHRLHPNGRLSAIWLAHEEEIEGVPCSSQGSLFNRLGTLRMVFFYEDGRLRQAHLSRDVSLHGHAFKKGEIVTLSPIGKLDLTAVKVQ